MGGWCAGCEDLQGEGQHFQAGQGTHLLPTPNARSRRDEDMAAGQSWPRSRSCSYKSKKGQRSEYLWASFTGVDVLGCRWWYEQ